MPNYLNASIDSLLGHPKCYWALTACTANNHQMQNGKRQNGRLKKTTANLLVINKYTNKKNIRAV